MKSSILTYPEFNTLPKGIKMMLLESESFFFNEEQSRPVRPQSSLLYPMRFFKLQPTAVTPSGFAPSLAYAA